MRAAGHTARILEVEITTRPADILEQIGLARPDVILLSVYIWNSTLVDRLLPDVHALHPEARVILGGPEVSYTAEEWLAAHPWLTAVVCGGGEEAVRHLAEAGFDTAETGTIVSIPNRPFAEVPFPYLEEDFERLAYRYVYYESSRGCPCACTYCVSGREDQKPDYRSVETTTAELSRIIAEEPRWPAPPIVKLVDRTFNSRPPRAREIWRFLAKADTQATFHFEIHPAFLTERDFGVLAEAPPGRFQFEIGVQSTHEATLAAVRRRSAWKKARPHVARLIELGTIVVHLDLIAGLPEEGPAEIARSVDDVMALKPDRFDLGFLKSLPGTAVRRHAHEHDQVAMHHAPYQVLSNAWLSLADFALLRRIERVIDSLWNANALEEEIDELADRYGGYFNAFRAAAERAEHVGYNLATRKLHKVRSFIQSELLG